MTQLTQEEIKELARNMVGDGKGPNKWFVTQGPYYAVHDKESGDYDFVTFDKVKDVEKATITYGPFNSYKEALDAYDDIELDEYSYVGQVMIEDRQCGVVTEKYLSLQIREDFVQVEHDDSKLFYKK